MSKMTSRLPSLIFMVILFLSALLTVGFIPPVFATPPTVTITSPLNSARVNDTTPTISGTASAASGQSVTLVEVQVDSGAYSPATGTTSWSLTTATLLTGAHTITARATNNLSETSTTSITIIVDTTTPSAPSITSPTSGTTTNDNTPAIDGTQLEDFVFKFGTTGSSNGQFDAPQGVSVDSSGNVYVADTNNDRIQKFTSTSTYITKWGTAGSSNGQFNNPIGVVTDSSGNVYVADASNNRIQKFTSTGTYITKWGTAGSSNGQFNNPIGVTIDSSDNVYVADMTNNRIQKFTSTGTYITKWGSSGSGNGQFSSPVGVTIDSSDNVYVADTGNDRVQIFELPVTIQVFDGGTNLLGTASPSISGSWTFTPSALTDGLHTITAVAIDEAGNTSPTSNSISITIDAVPPAAPSITTPASGTNTNDNTPTISGTKDADTSIQAFDTDGTTVIGSTGVTAGTAWTITTSALSDGTHDITAKATDGGGTSPGSGPIFITIDTVVPTGTILIDSGSTYTNSPTVTLTLSCTDSTSGCSEMKISVDGTFDTEIFESFATSKTVTLPSGDGAKTVKVIFKDAAGNVSVEATDTIILDTAAPLAPSITSPADGTITNDNTPTISGTAEASSTVLIFDGASEIGTTSASGTGSWSFTPSSALAEGIHSITAKATDAANNASPASGTVSIAVDLAAPTVSAPSVSPDPANVNPTVTSTATDGGTNIVSAEFFIDSVGANGAGTAMAASDGAFNSNIEAITGTINIASLSEGSHTVYVHAKDAAGNWGSTQSITFTVDTAAPLAPSITSPADGTITNDNTPTISGTAEASSTVLVFDGAAQIGTTSASGTGSWSFTVGTLTDGTHDITAKALDTANNLSPASLAASITIETSNPTVFITSPSDNAVLNTNTVTVTGTSEDVPAGVQKVEVQVDAGSFQLATGTTSWSFTTSALTEGNHIITAKATDNAGNIAAASITVIIDTMVPTAPMIDAPATPTNDNTPTLTGTKDADTSVQLFDTDGITVIGSTGITGGTWTIAALALSDGTHSITAKATDAANNVSPASSAVSVTVDTVAPAAPMITSPADNTIFNYNIPTISGTAEASSTVLIFDGASEIGTTSASGTGSWSFTPSSALAEGIHSITAKATDLASNTSPASNIVSITVDTAVPIGTVFINSDAQHATSASVTLTLSCTDSTSGCSEMKISVDGTFDTEIFESFATSKTVTLPSGDGAKTVKVIFKDAAGNVSVETNDNIILDVTNPTVSITSPSDNSVHNTNTIAVSGSSFDATSGIQTVEVQVDTGALQPATGTMSWSFTTAILADGAHTITAKATDNAGNIATAVISVTVDTVPPPAPSITSPADGTITNDNTPTISGTAEASSTVLVFDGAAQIGSTSASGTGSWSFTVGTLADGTHSVTAKSIDAAGNTGLPSSAITITTDTVLPSIPEITVPLSGFLTNDNTPTISGTAEASSTVLVFDGAAQIGSTSASGTGSWSFTVGTLADGTHIVTAKATDLASNTSPASSVVSITVDTIALAPIITTPQTGESTNDNTPTISGTTENGAMVTLFDNAVFIGSTIANVSGSWSFTPAIEMTEDVHVITAQVIDIVGNASPLSSATSFTIDQMPPLAPSITQVSPNTLSNDNTPTISGRSEAGMTIRVYDGSSLLGSTTASPAGRWSFTPPAALSDGAHTLFAVAVDAASNFSLSSTTVSIQIDTVAPSAPLIVNPAQDITTGNNRPIISGTAESYSEVEIKLVNGENPSLTKEGTVMARASGLWVFKSTALSPGTYSVIVKAIDAAGNIGPSFSPAPSITIEESGSSNGNTGDSGSDTPQPQSSGKTTLSVDPIEKVPWGEEIFIRGFLLDRYGNGIPGKTITFTGTGSGNLDSAITDAYGEFTVHGSSVVSVGSWNVQAHFAGGAGYFSSDSMLVTYYTVKHRTALSLDLLQDSVQPGEIYTISGSLVDADSGQLIAGKAISFTARSPITISGQTTDGDGSFEVLSLQAPDDSGVYQIKALFFGNSYYEGSSNSASLSVQ